MISQRFLFAMKFLRLSLAVVFLWFGFLKLFNVSPVFDIIASVYPFITSHQSLYLLLALFEIVVGVGMLVPRMVVVSSWVMIGHLALATFGVLLTPQAFTGSFPFLSVVGEFVVKNFVLMAGAFVVLVAQNE